MSESAQCKIYIEGQYLCAQTFCTDWEGRDTVVATSYLPLSDFAKALEPYLPTSPEKAEAKSDV